MPSITATPQPAEGRILIMINWSDNQQATFARVLRIEPDGTSTPVRPHTFADSSGDYIELSGGQAILYDTEAPLNTLLTYTTDALGIEGTPVPTLVANDDFTRVVAAGSWGTATSGQAWTAASANLSVNGTTGLVSHPAANDATNNQLASPVLTDCEITGVLGVPGLATGASLITTLRLRINGSNYYQAQLSWTTTGNVTITIQSVPGFVNLGSAQAYFTYAGAATANVRLRIIGQTLQARTWRPVDTEPATWDVTTTNANFASGVAGARSQKPTGNTNATPTINTFDNINVYDLTTLATASTTATLVSTVPWLKAPLRPWADQDLSLTQPTGDPACVDGDAIFFAAMAEESRPNRTTTLVVNNRKNPIALNRIRGGIVSALRLISRTFVARDAVITLNEEGDPLFFQAPAVYGIPDRYMSVVDYTVARMSVDHRREWRVNTLPHIEVDRPAGLAAGILGNRWIDICDTFETFDDANAAGLTWTGVLLGQAADPPLVTGFRLYSDIPLDFATYADIPTGGRTYEQLLEGD